MTNAILNFLVDLFAVVFHPGNEAEDSEVIRWHEMLIEHLKESYTDEFAHTSVSPPALDR